MTIGVQESKGWKNRRTLAGIKRETFNDDDRAAIRAERQRMADERDAADRLAAEAEVLGLAEATCMCTACGGTGSLTVTNAMRVVEALHNYGFQTYQPSKLAVAALAAIARGVEPAPGSPIISFSYGSHRPTPGGATVTPRPAPIEPPKPSRKTKSVESDDVFLPDGALLEI